MKTLIVLLIGAVFANAADKTKEECIKGVMDLGKCVADKSKPDETKRMEVFKNLKSCADASNGCTFAPAQTASMGQCLGGAVMELFKCAATDGGLDVSKFLPGPPPSGAGEPPSGPGGRAGPGGPGGPGGPMMMMMPDPLEIISHLDNANAQQLAMVKKLVAALFCGDNEQAAGALVTCAQAQIPIIKPILAAQQEAECNGGKQCIEGTTGGSAAIFEGCQQNFATLQNVTCNCQTKALVPYVRTNTACESVRNLFEKVIGALGVHPDAAHPPPAMPPMGFCGPKNPIASKIATCKNLLGKQ